MKKVVSVIVVLILLASLSLCVSAEERTSFANAVELMEYWGEVGYPDDVGSIYSTDGTPEHLTVQLVGDTDGSRAAEIAAMLADPSTITFEEGRFTDQELHAISQNIQTELMPEDAGIHSCSVGWGKGGGFGISGRELRVVVNVDEDRVEEYAAVLAQRYGEAVVVEAARERPSEMENASTEPAPDAAPSSDIEAIPNAEPAADPKKVSEEAPADAVPGLGDSAPEKISEKTESTILTAALLAIVLLLAIFLLIARTRKQRK